MPERMLDGRYRLVDRIGAGGMGEVWRAHDEHLRREVAVKLVTGLVHGQDPTTAERFVREARAVARLSSPHIVTVYELGTAPAHDGAALPYIVMELIEGRRLDRLIHGGDGLPELADVARWAGQMCKALGTAHAAKVVHRDMKPSNVLVAAADPADPEDSLVKVLDFGIARLLDASGAPTALTATGSVVGTPAYMSPEQAQGDVPVDARTDLYSLGCILYELATGRLPFEAPVWHVLLRKHMDEPPVPPSHHRPELPVGWDELILALLEKDPADRPSTAGEARRRLAELEGRTGGGAIRIPDNTGLLAPTPPPSCPPRTPAPAVDARADTRTAPPAPRHTPTWVEPVVPSVPAYLPPDPARSHSVTAPIASSPTPSTMKRIGGLGYVAMVLVWLTVVLLVSWKIGGALFVAGVVWYLATRGRKHFEQGFYQGKHR